MKGIEFYEKNRQLYYDDEKYRDFESLFFNEFGENGLDYLQYKKCIHDSQNNCDYFIDFAVEVDEKKYAIILDDNSYGTEYGANENFVRDERINEIIRQGYKIICYSTNHHRMYPLHFEKELRNTIPLPSYRWINGSWQLVNEEPKKNTIRETPLITEMKKKKRKDRMKNIKILLLTPAIIIVPILLLKWGGGLGAAILSFAIIAFFLYIYDIPNLIANWKNYKPDDYSDPRGPHGY